MPTTWSPNDEAFVQAVETCTLPGEEFSHKAHVRLAWLYLLAQPYEQALQRMESSILRYATHLGAASKYHRTITVAWMRLVASAMEGVSGGTSLDELLEFHPNLLTARALEPFYSAKCLKSEEARTQFVEPDLAPLPQLEVAGACPAFVSV